MKLIIRNLGDTESIRKTNIHCLLPSVQIESVYILVYSLPSILFFYVEPSVALNTYTHTL